MSHLFLPILSNKQHKKRKQTSESLDRSDQGQSTVNVQLVVKKYVERGSAVALYCENDVLPDILYKVRHPVKLWRPTRELPVRWQVLLNARTVRGTGIILIGFTGTKPLKC
uniref:Uncharacterized protein n=1 Tax=Anopheles maculatus TaxID=74869 RepID=A0A182SCW8_9DIPT